MPRMRRLMPADRTGNHMEYHQVGTPMAGAVSPQLYSSSAMRTSTMVSITKNNKVRESASTPKRNFRLAVPQSANSSTQLCTLRTSADEQNGGAERMARGCQ